MAVFHPEGYHGQQCGAPFFEGWYIKLVSRDQGHVLILIPGVSKSKHPDASHAFLQIVHHPTGFITYLRFPLSEWSAAEHQLDIALAGSRFTSEGIYLSPDTPGLPLYGTLHYGPLLPWPVTVFSPGAMGGFAWVPFMQCYHAVISLTHSLTGELLWEKQRISFDRGQGYIEKDWGSAFPSAYVWFQSNHFNTMDGALTGTIATIPWLGSSFRGFIIGLYLHGRLIRFTTYQRSRLRLLCINDDEIHIMVQNRTYLLEIRAPRRSGHIIQGPSGHHMDRPIHHTPTTQLHLTLFKKKTGECVFTGQGYLAGLEIQGDLDHLIS